MTNAELIAKLQTFPPDLKVAIFDWKKCRDNDDGDGSSVGVYLDFEISEQKLDGEDEREYYRDRNDGMEYVPWLALSFSNEELED